MRFLLSGNYVICKYVCDKSSLLTAAGSSVLASFPTPVSLARTRAEPVGLAREEGHAGGGRPPEGLRRRLRAPRLQRLVQVQSNLQLGYHETYRKCT